MNHLVFCLLVILVLKGGPAFSQEVENPHIKTFEDSLAKLRKDYERDSNELERLFVRSAEQLRAQTLEKLEQERKNATLSDLLDKALSLRDLSTWLASRKFKVAGDSEESPIPDDAAKFGKHRYIIVRDIATWHVAQDIAKSRGGHLARIRSKEEFEFIRKLCREDGFAAYWVDGSDEATEGSWLFSDGTNANIDFLWEPGAALAPGDVNHHVELVKDRGFFGRNVSSGLRRRFIVEWDLQGKP